MGPGGFEQGLEDAVVSSVMCDGPRGKTGGVARHPLVCSSDGRKHRIEGHHRSGRHDAPAETGGLRIHAASSLLGLACRAYGRMQPRATGPITSL
jgi:hypothetical protein